MSEQELGRETVVGVEPSVTTLPLGIVVQGAPWQFNEATGRRGVADLDHAFNFSVPAGRTLAVTSASIQVSVPSGQSVLVSLSGSGPGGLPLGLQYIVMVRQGTFRGRDFFVGNQQMLLWVAEDGGFLVERSDDEGVLRAVASATGFFTA